MRLGHSEGCYYQLAATAQRPVKHKVFSHLTTWQETHKFRAQTPHLNVISASKICQI